MDDYQSSYTGAQLDAAIASYVNRTTGQIILTPAQLYGSLPDGYYSGVSASLDYSSLTAGADDALSGKTLLGANGLVAGNLIDGLEQYYSNTLTFDSPTDYNGYIVDIGFVPNFFVLFYAGTSAISAATSYTHVLMSFYTANVNTGSYLSEFFRGMYNYRSGSDVNAGKIAVYTSYNFKPYEN